MKEKNIQKNNTVKDKSSQAGVALLMVTFVMALATIIIVQLSYSTMLTSQQNTNLQRATQGEYLLKSLESLAIVLLNNDLNKNYDAQIPDLSELNDPQAFFAKGQDVSQLISLPPELENISVTMQLVPCNAYFSFDGLEQDIKRQQIILALFDYLDLENLEGDDTTELLSNTRGENVNLVTNIVDYLDSGNEDYNGLGQQGIESKITDKNIQKLWDGGKIYNLGTLYNLPKFNMNKVNALAPYMCLFNKGDKTTSGNMNINLNYATPEVLSVLNDFADGGIDIEQILTMQQTEDNGIFRSNNDIITTFNDMGIAVNTVFPANFFKVSSDYWELIGKVSIGNSTSIIRSIIKRGQGNSQNSNSQEIIEREMIF